VLYVNSIVMRKFNVAEGAMFLTRLARKLRSIKRGLVEAEPNFFVYSPLTFPVHHLPGASTFNQLGLRIQVGRALRHLTTASPIVWVVCPTACETALHLRRSALVYQRSDRYEEYPGVDPERVYKMDLALKREADLTFFVNRSLYEQEKDECRAAYLLDHGVDYHLFAEAEKDPCVPQEMQGVPKPIIGFFGGIDDHTSDIALVTDVARRCADMTFVFVGDGAADVSALEVLPNVRLVGQRPYEQIPHYGKCFDVVIMPWRQNRWIEACNPIKLKEYLALGKPVVSTPFRELERYDGLVYIARNSSEFAAALRRALDEDTEPRRKARRARVEHHTWDHKAQEALDAIRAECGERIACA